MWLSMIRRPVVSRPRSELSGTNLDMSTREAKIGAVSPAADVSEHQADLPGLLTHLNAFSTKTGHMICIYAYIDILSLRLSTPANPSCYIGLF